MAHKFYDNTRISSFRFCPRSFYFRHVRHWSSTSTKIWFTFGGAWHAAMDELWRYAPQANEKDAVALAYRAFCNEWIARGEKAPEKLTIDDLEELTPRTPMIAKEMLHGYYTARAGMFKASSFVLVDVEQPFAVPLSPTDDTFQYVGRLDKVFEWDGALRIGEHKTTTAYRKDGHFRSDFLDSFSPNSQVDGYQYAAGPLYNNRLRSIWIDAALVHKTVHDGFKFIAIDRGDSALDAWLWETHDWIAQIEMNKAALAEPERINGDYMAAFPRNTSNCGQCGYRDICRAMPNPHRYEGVPLGYKYEPWSPFSEIALEKIGFKPEEDTRP